MPSVSTSHQSPTLGRSERSTSKAASARNATIEARQHFLHTATLGNQQQPKAVIKKHVSATKTASGNPIEVRLGALS